MRAVTPHNYYHPQDRAALDAMKQIPGFTTVLKAFMKVFNEKMVYGMSMAQKIKLGPDQLPHIYKLLPPICKTLAIDEPILFLEMDPVPNGYTFGDTQAFITLTSGLVEQMEPDEIAAVLAHECGHIACRHVLYHTMASIVLGSGADILGLGIIATPVKLALFEWERFSELSCDRAAAICMGGSDVIVDVMIRLSGGGKAVTRDVNLEAYISQAEEYNKLIATSSWNKTLQFLAVMGQSHPFSSVRAREVINWCKSSEFQTIMQFMNQEGDVCIRCGEVLEEAWQFCKKCGKRL